MGDGEMLDDNGCAEREARSEREKRMAAESDRDREENKQQPVSHHHRSDCCWR